MPKEAYLIDFLDPEDVKTECTKYLKDPSDLPRGQENQLSYLVMKFKAQDLKVALVKLITIVGGFAPRAFHPIATTKASIAKDFLRLIYDHKSMMIDIDESSYRYVLVKYSIFEYISSSVKYSSYEYFFFS